MPEENSYPGSPSLSAEAREKVLQTFRHTVELARNGRNEEALLGCDFILKMDARFQPARKLLETLRGVAAGTMVDLSGFSDFIPAAAPEPARPSASLHDQIPGGTVAVPSFSVQPGGGGLDDLAFADFGAADPFGAPPPTLASGAPLRMPPQAPAPARPAAPPAPAPPPAFGDPFAAPADPFGGQAPDPFAAPQPYSPQPYSPPPAFAPAADPFAPPQQDLSWAAPQAAAPDSFQAPDPFSAPPPDPFAAAPNPFAPSAAPSLPGGDPFGAASSAPTTFGDAFGAQPGPPPSPLTGMPSFGPSSAVDPRITQFLKQGDEAISRGHVQEAIDLWSRVFLIDLSNEEASRRIDQARDRQADNARRVDTLLQEAIQQFEASDHAGARTKFLEVLTLSENDATAKSYLAQIESSKMPEQAPDMRGASSDFMKDELEVPSSPSFAAAGMDEPSAMEEDAQEESRPERAEPRKSKGGGMDVRMLLAAGVGALLLIGGGAYFLLRKKPTSTPPAVEHPVGTTPGTGAGGGDVGADALVKQAEQLIADRKCTEALAILTEIPVSDVAHGKALELIERCKSAPPELAAPAFSAADLERLRVDGLAYFKSYEFIKAVQALDPYVKAHPDDTEAIEALTRSRERVSALGSAVKAFNEQDYESAIKMLWEIKKQDLKASNQDVDEYLFKSYFNDAVQSLQAGNSAKAAAAFQEATAIRPKDEEAQRHLRFAKKYKGGMNDLLSRIYVKHVAPRS